MPTFIWKVLDGSFSDSSSWEQVGSYETTEIPGAGDVVLFGENGYQIIGSGICDQIDVNESFLDIYGNIITSNLEGDANYVLVGYTPTLEFPPIPSVDSSSLTISGTPSTPINSIEVSAGNVALDVEDGSVSIENGAALEVDSVFDALSVGTISGEAGTITVAGQGSYLEVGNAPHPGADAFFGGEDLDRGSDNSAGGGTGALAVSSGATLVADGDLFFGDSEDTADYGSGVPGDNAVGTAVVSGAGSVLFFSSTSLGYDYNALGLGVSNGTGFLEVNDGGSVEGADIIVGREAANTGTVLLSNGTITANGTAGVGSANGTLSVDTAAVSIASGGTLIGNGLVNAPIANTGTIEASGGTLIIDGAVSGTGTTMIDTDSVLDVTGSITGQTILFEDATGRLDIGFIAGFSGTVGGFQPGDTLDFSGTTADATTFDQATGVLTLESISGATTADVGTLHVAGSYDPSWFQLADTDGTAVLTDAPCFVAGTRILTDHGEVAVEALRIGDRVRSHFRQWAAVTWLGHRHVACARHPRPWDVRPVRVQAGAFGPGLPQRDLLLSPDHAVFVADKLMPIRYLINGVTVTQEVMETVTYWHVELSRHDVIFAEGLSCESYLDTGNRAAFANGGGLAQIHPDFRAQTWTTHACAPLVLGGKAVTAVRADLLDRAHTIGHRLTQNPGLHVLVDGRIVRPRTHGNAHHFRLPRGAGVARLVSRIAVPAWVRADSDDHRRLGVAVARVGLDGQAIPLADVSLGAGWHGTEADGGWRWTNGDAALDVAGARTLAVEVAITEQYWLAPRRTRARAA